MVRVSLMTKFVIVAMFVSRISILIFLHKAQ